MHDRDTSDVYLYVGDSYIENVQFYYDMPDSALEEVYALSENAMVYMVPKEYKSGKLCVYVKDERERYTEKYAVQIVWE